MLPAHEGAIGTRYVQNKIRDDQEHDVRLLLVVAAVAGGLSAHHVCDLSVVLAQVDEVSVAVEVVRPPQERMTMKTFLLLAMLTVACDPPNPDLVLNCQKACAPRPVKEWTWDGYNRSAKCECDRGTDSR